jgi:hypothetical protein
MNQNASNQEGFEPKGRLGLPGCPSFLIEDHPGDKDSVTSDSPHKAVAVAISEVLLNSTGGISIGVEGRWGSGKTTIINLLEDELRSKKVLVGHQTAAPEDNLNSEQQLGGHGNQTGAERDFALIRFDAWAHEGDPLRRTFLEALITELIDVGWLDKREWTNRLEIIRQKREVKSTKSYPRLNFWHFLIAGSLLLVPIGVPFIAAAIKDDNLSLAGEYFSRKFLLGLALTTAPLWTFLIVFLVTLRRGRRGENQTDMEEEPPAWSMFFNKVVSNEQTVTSKTPNPTSVEFEQEFTDAMQASLTVGGQTSQSNRHVVVVVDNLDRVDAEDALAIWSTLQTFFHQKRDSGTSMWSGRIWAIVLYDQEGIRGLWEKADNSGRGKQSIQEGDSAEPNTLEAQRAGDVDVALSFLDKSFPVRFEVPPPVLSDWHAELKGMLNEAVRGHETEFHAVYSVLRAYLAAEKRLPTLRELKLFVNQISALHLLRTLPKDCEKKKASDAAERSCTLGIPLAHVAYYVLLYRQGRNVIVGLLNKELPETQFTALLGEGVERSLAALSYGVSEDKAIQLLLGPKIENALFGPGKEKEDLTDLGKRHDGFWEVLESIVGSLNPTQDAEKITAIVRAINNSGLFTDTYVDGPTESRRLSARSIIPSVKAYLADAARKVSFWPAFDEGVAEVIAELASWKDHPRVSTPADRIEFLRPYAVSAAASIYYSQSGSSPASPAGSWASGIEHLLKKLNAEDSDLSSFIINEVSAPLLKNGKLEGAEIEARLEAIYRLRELASAAKDRLNDFVDGFYLFDYAKMAYGNTESRAVAWCVFILLGRDQGLSPSSPLLGLIRDNPLAAVILEDTVPEITRALTDIIIEHDRLDMFFSGSGGDRAKILDTSLKLALEGGGAEKISASLTPANALERLDSISKVLTDYGKPQFNYVGGAIRRLAEETDFIRQVQSGRFNPSFASAYNLLLIAVDGTRPEKEVSEWLMKGMTKVSKDVWLSELISQGALLTLALSEKLKPELGKEYKKALYEYAKLLASNADMTPWRFDGVDPIDRLVDENLRMSLSIDLLRFLESATSNIHDEFFKVFSTCLTEPYTLLKDDIAVERLFWSILVRRDEAGLRWMIDLLSNSKISLDYLRTDNVRSMVRSKLRQDLATGANDPTVTNVVWGLILELAQILSVNDKPYYEVLWERTEGQIERVIATTILEELYGAWETHTSISLNSVREREEWNPNVLSEVVDLLDTQLGFIKSAGSSYTFKITPAGIIFAEDSGIAPQDKTEHHRNIRRHIINFLAALYEKEGRSAHAHYENIAEGAPVNDKIEILTDLSLLTDMEEVESVSTSSFRITTKGLNKHHAAGAGNPTITNQAPIAHRVSLKPELSYHLKNVDDIAGIDYYNLDIAVDNNGETTVRDLRVNVEIPRANMEVNTNYGAEVDSRTPSVTRFFKYPVGDSPPNLILDPGERKSIFTLMLSVRKEQYLVDTNDVIKVWLYTKDHMVAKLEMPIAEMLNKERVTFYQARGA